MAEIRRGLGLPTALTVATFPRHFGAMKWIMAIAALSMASCSEESSVEPRVPLTGEQQEARFKRCSDELAQYRQQGLVKHGGARPGVDTGVLESMSEEDQQSFAETVACVSKAGQIGSAKVEVTAEGLSAAYRTYQADNAE